MSAQNQTPHAVDQQKTEVLSDGHFRLDRITLRHETFAGEMSQLMMREVLRSGRAVAVLLYDPAADCFVMVEQFRVGAHLNQLSSAWLLECVAGMLDEGETAESAARREVQEETGCEVREMEPIGEYLTSPGITDELITVYIGAVNAAHAGGIHGQPDEAEDIRTCVITRDEALAAADDGSVPNMTAQLALLWFARHGEGLRQRWLAAAGPL